MACSKMELRDSDLICPMIDARRMEVYASVFDHKLNKIADTKAIVLDEHSFDDYTSTHKIRLVGDGADKCTQLYQNIDNVEVHTGIYASAIGMASPAERCLANKDFVDVAYFEPFYLKDFVAGVPKVKALR